MEIRIASIGFCVGITRAYRRINRRASEEADISVTHQNSMGDFDTLRRIERGDPELLLRYPELDKVSIVHDVAALGEGDRLMVGYHGLAGETKESLAARGVDMVEDATCPFIARLDRMVERFVLRGYDIAIMGKRGNHHCRIAESIANRNGQRCFVIEVAADIDRIPHDSPSPLALVGQVTGNTMVFDEVIAAFKAFGRPIEIVRTICTDSYERQQTAMNLAQEADVVIVFDDGGAAAQSVFEVCTRFNACVHRVKAKEEIRADWFVGARSVGITSGILVPEWSIEQLAEHVREMCS